MKRITIIGLLLWLSISGAYAQNAPELINYQAALRDKEGKVMSARSIKLRFTVHASSAAGAVVYQETHSAVTTATGLVNLPLGGGTPSTGVFADIDWKAGAHFLQVEVLDVEAGSNYTDLGTQQLVSVPYALHANHAFHSDKATGMGLDDLTDVSVATPATGEVLKWDGTAWKPAADLNVTVPSGAAGGDLSGTYPDPSIKNGAVTVPKLDLSNDLTAPANKWMGLTVPTVDFGAVSSFPDSKTWGISGKPENGTIVYNPGFRLTNGFKGVGFYGWSNGMWIPIAVGDGAGGLGKCEDPGKAVGSLGCVTFTYNGAEVTYMTVRAADGNIWLQQNLGSKQVAASLTDADSYGDLFQFGRWDDGHQLRNSTTVATSTINPNNPAGIVSGNKNFIAGSPYWWATGAAATNTWSATNLTPSASNGKDPCAALGAGWKLPTSKEWEDVVAAENISGNITSAFNSNLKVSAAGDRSVVDGKLQNVGTQSIMWSSTPGSSFSNSLSFLFQSGQVRSATLYRGGGASCRCVKK